LHIQTAFVKGTRRWGALVVALGVIEISNTEREMIEPWIEHV
jgi:hypothetical protein